ncbi:hypothetical protein ACH49_19565 [Streptomyces leeuwenhoekii]|uniref:Tetratricopeptide repeat protein n=1 Tax=Streptomyces leeuwenhoekii TaxID=1437453 RepID=A0ABR5HW87_STRLW|nr:tetratricopeptide repeat protein [Streptomyces leeuwenhoekii]KMS77720.1 hypothetical protein ACH49_19565 [Streptomyces leeuwenhoekii]
MATAPVSTVIGRKSPWLPPAKFDFYAMDCHRVTGADKLARTLAEEVLRAGTAVDGTERSPMRNAEARITLGVTAARAGDPEQALARGERALEAERRSVPSPRMLGRELAVELRRRYGAEPAVREHLARLPALDATAEQGPQRTPGSTPR